MRRQPSGEGQIFVAQQSNDGIEGGCPVLFGSARIVTESFNIEAKSKAFLRAGKVDQRGAKDAVEHSKRAIECPGMAGQAVEQLLVLVEGSEDGAFAPEDIDVADESVCRVVDGSVKKIKVEPKPVELVGMFFGAERPDIALGSKDRRPRRVKSAKSMHQRRMQLGFGKVIEIIWIFAEVDETAIPGGV